MRISQDKLPPAIDLGRAVPDGMRRRLAKVGVLLREDGEGGACYGE